METIIKLTSTSHGILALGRQLENNVRSILFDCSALVEEFGDGEATLAHQRFDDVAPYPVTIAGDGDVYTWNITDADTAYCGMGRAEVRWITSDGLGKSVTFMTQVLPSLTGDSVIPEPLQSWYDNLIQYINDHSITEDQLEQAVADYIEAHPISAPVQSVNGETGDVVLSAADVGAIATSDLQTAVNAALAQAKASGQFDGKDGKDGLDGDDGLDGNGIASAVLNADYTLTLRFTDGTSYTTPSIRGAQGETGAKGEPGEGIPSGGTEGQILVKSSGTDYDAEWGDGLSDLKNALSNIAEMMPVDVDTEFEQGYRHSQTGCALKSSNAWCTSTVPISLIKGTTVSIESGYKYQLIDPAPENNGAVLVSQAAEQYTATSDVIAYIEVRNNAGTALTPIQAQSVITVSKTPAIVTMVNASSDILADISVRSKNLFNKNDIVNGEFVRSSDGTFVANANFWRSNFIAVTGGETYTLRYINQVAFYTAETASSFISGVGGYSTGTAATSSTFIAPSDAKYIVICGHNTQLDSDQLEIGDSFTGYAEYGYVVKQPSGQGYTRISDIMSKIIFANNPVKIKLIGDSTTAGQGGTGYTNDASHGELILTDDGYGSYYTNPSGCCWANLLKSYFEDHFNCTVTNFGCSGMRVHRMVLYLDTLISDDDDIIIFMGGLNDRNDNSAHTTLQNLASDIQAIIDYCHSHGKSIIIMSPIPTLDNETGTKNFKTDDIDHVYMYAANMNGMEYISVFRRMNSYCLTSGVSLADLLNADSLHPNDSGYNIMFDIICDGLNIGIYPVK